MFGLRSFPVWLLLPLLLVPAGGVEAQQPFVPSSSVNAQLFATEPVPPGRAFLRAILVPGWGHVSIGEHTRGGFYFLSETAAAWMVVRTRTRLGAAKNVRDLRVAELGARLAAEGVTDPSAIISAENRDPGVTAARALVEARSQQFEDWLVLGVFLVFLGGADAFVSAHLRDFPDPVGFQVGADGAFGLSLSIPLLRASRPVEPASSR